MSKREIYQSNWVNTTSLPINSSLLLIKIAEDTNDKGVEIEFRFYY